jgi:NADH-quinone oxidoreductase subunit J
MLEAIVFYSLAAFVLGFGVLVVTTRDTVHSVLFLVGNLLCVAMLYVALSAEFLAVIQVLVYAGGIVVLYLFVVMLVNLKRTPEVQVDPRRQSRLGFAAAAAVLLEMSAIVVYSATRQTGATGALPASVPAAISGGNTERIGWLLYTDYLVPFEVASVLLLVAMVGAILLARREA